MSFVLIGSVGFPKGGRDAFLPLLARHRERCLAGEPGTLAFEALSVIDDENALMLYELYRDEEAFRAHWDGESIAILRQEATAIETALDATFCTLCAPVEAGKRTGKGAGLVGGHAFIVDVVLEQAAHQAPAIEILLRHRWRCLDDELGTLQFEIMTVNDDDRRLIVYEVYTDEAAFQAHRAAESVGIVGRDIEAAGIVGSITGTACALA